MIETLVVLQTVSESVQPRTHRRGACEECEEWSVWVCDC